MYIVGFLTVIGTLLSLPGVGMYYGRKYAKDHWSTDRVEIITMQHAFHGFDLNTLGLGVNSLVLVVYAAVVLGLAGLTLQRSNLVH